MIPARRIISPNELPVATANLCGLAVMTKAPRAGQVKTRLSPPLTPQEAAELNVCFLRDISAAISQAGNDTRGIGCYTPVGSEEAYHDILPASFELIAQRNGDFGQRLAGAVEDLLAFGFGSVCLINSDSPTATASVFTEAARLLSSPNDLVVLGPSDDGGYYLIGMKKFQPRLFERIDWSTDRVLSQTVERAGEVGLEVRFLPACYDVDDRTTLRRLCHDLFGPNDGQEREIAPATREFLREIIDREGRQRIWPTPSALPRQ